MRRGVLLAVVAYLLWGFLPVYWPLLEPAGALEILAHRMLWSAVVMVIGITVFRQWRLTRGLGLRTWLLISIASVVISANWGVYIYAVNNGHVVEASLGYFINPLLSVALGVIVLREKLTLPQWIAIGVAALGVILTSLGAGGVPYIGLALAGAFALYGLIKRVIEIPAGISLLGESGVLALPALGFLLWLETDGRGHFTGFGTWHAILMVGAGLVTVVPLLAFGAAARILPLSALGILQYMNPLTQFALGVWWAGEHMTGYRWLGFIVIWLALAIFTASAFGKARSQRRTRIRDTAHSGPQQETSTPKRDEGDNVELA